jgi:competence protein ComEA
MNSFRRSVSEWFGYSRRERRASMIIVIIIVIVILVRYLFPERGIDIEVNAVMPGSPDEKTIADEKGTAEKVRHFQFDPNTAPLEDLTLLGIPDRIAGTLIRYRNSGGTFRKPEDIMKVYGMDSLLAASLIPYIIIVHQDSGTRITETQIITTMEKIPVVMHLININRCDSADIEGLPGIGPVLSARIIKYRELLGGFVSVLQLKEVYGIADSVYRLISARISIDSSAVKQININSAGFRELDRHPYLERYEVQAIIKFRDIKGRINNLSELTSDRIISEAKAQRIAPYFSF